MKHAWISLALGAGLLAGCATLEPAYHRPAAPVPANFPSGPAYAPAAGRSEAAPADWRRVFTDPKLQAVIQQALINSRDLKVAVAQIEAARAQYHVQRAALLPAVNASAGVTTGRDYTGLPPAFGGAYQKATDYDVSVGATSYQLDLFGKIRSLTRQSLETYLATAEARRATEITLAASVAADYLTLAADESLLQVARRTVTSGEADLDLTRRRMTGGVATALDVANAETIVEAAKDTVASYTTQVAQDRNALDLVVGAPVAAENLPSGIDDPAVSLGDVPASLDSRVLLRRPDVMEAEHSLRAANADIGAARAAFFPAISLTGSGGSTTASLSGLFAPGTGVWSFGPTVSLPIFDSGANRANLAYARAEDRIEIAQYEKAIQSAFREVADALAQRGTIGERLRAERALVAAAGQSLALSEALYQRGSASYLDVLTAQRTLFSAQQSLIAVRLIQATNTVTLYKALGGGPAPDDGR